jgi:hypothetical protein
MDGKTRLSFPVEPSAGTIEKQLDLDGFSKGVYIILLKTSNETRTEKLIIQ